MGPAHMRENTTSHMPQGQREPLVENTPIATTVLPL